MSGDTLQLERRLRRTKSGESRPRTIGARITNAEERELTAAADRTGKNVSEWAREVLLREARLVYGDPLFTEIIATRTLLINLMRPLILGKKVTEEWVTEAMTVVRREKHKAAGEVMQQYAAGAAERR